MADKPESVSKLAAQALIRMLEMRLERQRKSVQETEQQLDGARKLYVA